MEQLLYFGQTTGLVMNVLRIDFQDFSQSPYRSTALFQRWAAGLTMFGNRIFIGEGIYIFAWEEAKVQELIHIIEEYNIVDGLEDEMRWQFEAFENYTVESFTMQVAKFVHTISVDWPNTMKIWKGLAPPRVELLVWFGLLKRLNIKDRLHKFSCIAASEILCVFCKVEMETIEHLFFPCIYGWSVGLCVLVGGIWVGVTQTNRICFLMLGQVHLLMDLKGRCGLHYYMLCYCLFG